VPTPPFILDLRRSYGSGLLLLPGVCAVLARDDLEPGRTHVLLVRRSDTGAWSLPAGIVEPGEQPATSLVRELYEETRVVARADRLAWLVADPDLVYPNGDRCQFITMVFRCSFLSGEAQVGDDESQEVGWFATDALPELDDRQLQRLEHGLSADERCAFAQ
jgi:ADP-ribose pyrophosphatase YjhB (NUDIX family)